MGRIVWFSESLSRKLAQSSPAARFKNPRPREGTLEMPVFLGQSPRVTSYWCCSGSLSPAVYVAHLLRKLPSSSSSRQRSHAQSNRAYTSGKSVRPCLGGLRRLRADFFHLAGSDGCTRRAAEIRMIWNIVYSWSLLYSWSRKLQSRQGS